MSNSVEVNPLLQPEFRVPFDRIRAEQVEPAARELLENAQARLDAIVAVTGPRSYDNTMRPFDRLTERLEFAMNVVRHLEAVSTTPDLRAAYNAVQPAVSAFYASIPLDAGLWNAIREYAATGEAQQLTGARKRFVEKTIAGFRRHGAELDAAGKVRLKEIDVELATVTTKFSENVLDSTNEFELVLTEEKDLAGLPPAAVAAARASAASKNREGWRFTLQAPSYLALMTYLDNREIR
ncbi:MAG: M3 family metallopeptidase, partial [Pseudomonadota bacterium]